MPPSMSAREREVLVVGRSYAPALLGWCSTMRSSLTWYPRSSSSTLGTPDCGASHPGVGLAMLKGNCHAKRCCFPSETRQVSVREEEAGCGKVRGKLPYTTGCSSIPQNDVKPLSF